MAGFLSPRFARLRSALHGVRRPHPPPPAGGEKPDPGWIGTGWTNKSRGTSSSGSYSQNRSVGVPFVCLFMPTGSVLQLV